MEETLIEKLELKHILPYANFNLKGKVKDYVSGTFEDSPEIWEDQQIESIDINDKIICFADAGDVYLDFPNEVKFIPYLRSLSQLTEEIEHNGEMVNVLGDELKLFQESVVGNKIVDFRTGVEIPIEHLEYKRVEILLKYHFDVFGLIEKGLAIEKTV